MLSNHLGELDCGHKDSAAAPQDLYEATAPWVVRLDMVWAEEGAVEAKTLGTKPVPLMPFLEISIQQRLNSVPSQSIPSLNRVELHKQKQTALGLATS